MVKLLIISDDLTGALDTGVQLAEKGINTEVITDINYDFSKTGESVEVLVINTDTRYSSSEDAYRIVHDICQNAIKYGIAHIYKKTDSALRGNIGSELAALLNASNVNMLPFIPAFPKMNRYTLKGIHYIDGIPVHQSVFGQDPFEPVKTSNIAELINTQINVPVYNVTISDPYDVALDGEGKICIFDAATEDDLLKIAERLRQSGDIQVMAGCAGFGSVLPSILDLSSKDITRPLLESNFLIVCGSLNQITKDQINYACENGFKRITLKAHEMLDINYYDTNEGKEFICYLKKKCLEEKLLIIDTSNIDSNVTSSLNNIRFTISNTLGYIIKTLMKDGLKLTLLITGGDTLLGFMKQFKDCKIIPICQLETGVVLSEFELDSFRFKIISKSGGFGNRDLFVKLARSMVKD